VTSDALDMLPRPYDPEYNATVESVAHGAQGRVSFRCIRQVLLSSLPSGLNASLDEIDSIRAVAFCPVVHSHWSLLHHAVCFEFINSAVITWALMVRVCHPA
jgi:hypothetical protein